MGVDLGILLPAHAVVEDGDGEARGVDLLNAVGAAAGEGAVPLEVRDHGAHTGMVGGHHVGFDGVVAESPQQ